MLNLRLVGLWRLYLVLYSKKDGDVSRTGYVFVPIRQVRRGGGGGAPIELSPTSITGCYCEYIKQVRKCTNGAKVTSKREVF